MTDKFKTASCHVCAGPPVDTRLLHEHHRHPKGYGGTDDPENLIWLCGSCHDLVHRLSHYLRSKKVGLVSDLAKQYQESRNMSPASRQRMLKLADVVAEAMETYTPSFEELEDEEQEGTILVQVPLPKSIHAKAKVLAASHTNPKSGRRMGLYKYLRRVLVNHVNLATNAPMLAKEPRRYFVADGNVGDPDDFTEATTKVEVPSSKQGGLKPL